MRRRSAIAALAALVAATPIGAAGDPLPARFLDASVAVDYPPPRYGDPETDDHSGQVAPVDASLENTVGALFHTAGTAHAAYGALGAYIEADAHDFFPGLFGATGSYARFEDNLTVTSGPASGTIEFVFHVTGFATYDDVDQLFPGLILNVDTTSDNVIFATVLDLNSGTPPVFPAGDFTSSPTHFTLGAPFHLQASLNAYIQAGGVTGSSAVAASVLYADSATITDVLVFDAGGQPVSDFAIASESGTPYPAPETAREDSAVAAVAALLFVARRR